MEPKIRCFLSQKPGLIDNMAKYKGILIRQN